VALACAACGHGGKPAVVNECRPLAIHGEALIAREPAAEREAATRLIASMIDLCQAPGLAASTRTCALAAPSIEGVRGCPALTEVVGDATSAGDGVSCREAIDRAMKLLESSGSRPRSRDGLIEARAAYLDGCAELSPAGRLCVRDAATIAAVDDCFADPALQMVDPP
jgi:hypothetical protein